ncbi:MULTISPECIES: hypothetical protein [Paenibacillus]|uniref:Uncharacterized protein n=1 Tax=Paenibacillus naphthalenovorans TaxID=162209 RepID=A0A0U2KWI0_9BACL|nr:MULTISPECIES: hypothetical protein [Paenibacillus]ALS21058.1 hypothetical protein IJ22_06730 [Paenibacillus naphthalenovorans]NTZ18717.1 hypothetical protein [Paenibacillus sp. JMULE4]GCL71092.1 hypothetical protein PN4B1_09960 [Paenibacillus naphthalenovorans]SDI62954.1 hypothetical protein SAMN05421868_108170 [Paenibacillus naphthalenovorans]
MNSEPSESPNKQRVSREMTYRDGRKRKTITGTGQAAALSSDEAGTLSLPESAWRRWGLLWREAPVPAGILKASIAILPAVLFALFVWMAYELSRYTF